MCPLLGASYALVARKAGSAAGAPDASLVLEEFCSSDQGANELATTSIQEPWAVPTGLLQRFYQDASAYRRRRQDALAGSAVLAEATAAAAVD